MLDVKIVGHGVDALVLNVCYADKQFQPVKRELDADLQEDLNSLQGEALINEPLVVMEWAFKSRSRTCSGNTCGCRSLRLICEQIASGGTWPTTN